MKLDLDKALALQLNSEAEVLLDAFAVEPEKPTDSISTFRPNYLMSAVNLTGKEVPNAPIQTIIDIGGNEIARFYPDLSPKLGLFEEHHLRFINLCRTFQQSEALRSTASITFVVEVVFEWMKRRLQNLATQSMTEYVLSKCETEIMELEVWVPIAGTEVEHEIQMGKVTLKPMLGRIWHEWVAGWQTKQPEGIEKIQNFLKGIGTKIISMAVLKVTAEPIKAVETALDHTEEALSILRYFSFANLHPPLSIYTNISGMEFVKRPKHMVLQKGLLISAGITEANMRSRHSWRINAALVSKMKEKGFDILVQLLEHEEDQRTEFQNSILRAINIYSKSSLAQDLNDKLLYVIAALEFILLKDGSESLQRHIGERMAFLIGESVEARADIIRSYKRAYALRSAAVHHGEEVKNADMITSFMQDAWNTFNKLITESHRFSTKRDLIEFIDDLKFS